MSVSASIIGAIAPREAHAQSTTQTITFSVPAGPLTQALAVFGRQSGLQVTYLASLASGKTSSGFSGQATRQQALARILQGSGLSYSFPNANTVAISGPGAGSNATATVDGAIALDTIDVSGGSAEGGTVYTPYETAAATSHISAESIERFRGSSPADMLRGTPGVMSGEARNSGALDVNIRGMQGMGRVAVTVDGAENGVSIYHGYQGMSNRTFLDPDFIASVDINKGTDLASRGIAGNVAVRTLDASDIVKPGETWGVRVKGEFGTNTSTPQDNARGGYAWPSSPTAAPIARPSLDGMDRPSLLEPTSGSGSFVVATKHENFDALLGYAERRQGNYHTGTNGPYAKPVNIGSQAICTVPTYCPVWPQYMDNAGIANYRPGEEVLNTQLETKTWLAKATIRFGDGHSLQIGYTDYVGEVGDRMASAFATERTQPIQQAVTAGTFLQTGTLRYRWKPAENDLINLKANVWLSDLRQRNQARNAFGTQPPVLGLPVGYRTGADTTMWGADIANTSKFSLNAWGNVDLTYGASWLTEDTRPRAFADVIEGWLNLRDAQRDEAGAFLKAAYKPFDWVTLNGGIRYSKFSMEDRRTWANSPDFLNDDPTSSKGGFSPSVGITLEPLSGVQLYANYSNALRFPSLVETSSTFTIIVNPDLEPERASNWEIGANFRKNGLLTAADRSMLKLGYFNWDISDYVGRQYTEYRPNVFGMLISNIDRARFSGLELSGRYEYNGLTADFAANYYLNVEFCPTPGTCYAESLYSDYATNHVPPEYSASLTLSQKLLDDKLTVGGRVSYMGPRAIPHGQATALGLSSFINQIVWEPYTLVDLFAEYKLNENLTAHVRVENLTDQFYVDPLGLVNQPGPGRTFYAGLTATLGGTGSPANFTDIWQLFGSDAGVRWSGLYAGVHGGAGLGHIDGTTTTLNGTPTPIAATESTDLSVRGNYLAGVQAGFNWQFGRGIVWGVEVDHSRMNTLTSQEARATEGSLAGRNVLQAATVYELDWMSTVRTRLGYAFENGLLLYGTGGVAFARETATRSQYVSTSASSSQTHGTATKFSFDERATETRTGWTLGVGAEYAINQNWSIKSEYSYTSFDDADFKFPAATAGTGLPYTSGGTSYPGSSETVNGRRASNALDLHAVNVGLNYRF